MGQKNITKTKKDKKTPKSKRKTKTKKALQLLMFFKKF